MRVVELVVGGDFGFLDWGVLHVFVRLLGGAGLVLWACGLVMYVFKWLL